MTSLVAPHVTRGLKHTPQIGIMDWESDPIITWWLIYELKPFQTQFFTAKTSQNKRIHIYLHPMV